jgi:hypothetical protein
MVGFAPSVLIGGPAAVAPLLQGLRVGCSGDDAVDVAGDARPLLVGCTLMVRYGKEDSVHAACRSTRLGRRRALCKPVLWLVNGRIHAELKASVTLATFRTQNF